MTFNLLLGRRLAQPVRPVRTALILAAGIAPLLTGCALQGPYIAPPVADDGTRLASAPTTLADPGWWAALQDPAVDELVDRSLASHPSLLPLATAPRSRPPRRPSSRPGPGGRSDPRAD